MRYKTGKEYLASSEGQEKLKELFFDVRNCDDFRKSVLDKITGEEVITRGLNSTDVSTRLIAVRKTDDQEILTKVALDDAVVIIRIMATGKITDQAVLTKILLESKDEGVRYAAVQRVEDKKILTKVALFDDSDFVRREAVKKLDDTEVLVKVLFATKSSDVLIEVVKKINDEFLLYKIASMEEYYNEVKKLAIEKLENQELLASVFSSENDKALRLTALRKIKDQGFLTKVALDDADMYSVDVREGAIAKLENQAALAKIALREYDSKYLRRQAIAKLEDIALLVKLLNDNSEEIRFEAYKRLINL